MEQAETQEGDLKNKKLDAEKQALAKFSPILKKYVEGESSGSEEEEVGKKKKKGDSSEVQRQIALVYAMQVFCHQKEWPKGLLLRLFTYMYDLEVVEEDAFLKWKEDLNDSYPGKGKALFQVNQWLTWLEQAESEEEDEWQVQIQERGNNISRFISKSNILPCDTSDTRDCFNSQDLN